MGTMYRMMMAQTRRNHKQNNHMHTVYTTHDQDDVNTEDCSKDIEAVKNTTKDLPHEEGEIPKSVDTQPPC